MNKRLKKQNRTRLFWLLLLPVLAFTCRVMAETSPQAERTEFAMDTILSVRVFGEGAEDAANAAVAEIRRLEQLLSAALDDSEISELNREKTATVSEDTLILVQRSLEIEQETEGAFNPALLPLMKSWGFPDRKYHVPSSEELKRLLPSANPAYILVDEEKQRISLTSGETEIDLGGIAKGYTSARLMELFRERGVEHAIVSLGGNVQVLGTKPDGSSWKIGIQDPQKEGGLLGVLETADCAVITSGGYERFFEEDGKRYHHILDPQTGYPAESGLVSVTIVSADGTLADALSTALFVMGRERSEAFWREHQGEFEMILQDEEGTLWVSEGLADVFSASGPQQIVTAAP